MGILFGVKAGMDAVAAGAQAAADASASLADATEAAGEAAKGALAPFDELNVLASKPDEAAPETPGTTTPIVDPAAVDEGRGELECKVKKFLDRLATFLAPVSKALGRLVEALKPLVALLLDDLAWAWENVIKPLGEWAVTTLLPAVIDVLAAGFTVLTAVLEAL